MIDILALDLGTSTGYAYNRGEEFACGTWTLGTAKEIRQWGRERLTRTKDPRIERLCENITALGEFDVIVTEDVQFASSVYQVQLWASLRAAVWLCGTAKRFEAVAVGTLKKFATGAGNADKDQMSLALRSTYPSIWKHALDDNAIDAAWAWIWARHTFSRMFK